MFSTFQRSPKAWKGIRSMFHANIHRAFNGQGQQSPRPRLLLSIKESRTTCLGATGSMPSNASVVLGGWPACELSCVWPYDPMNCSPPDSCPWDFSGKDTGVGCHFLGDLPNPGSNPYLLCLLHWQADSLSPVPPGDPKWSVFKKQNKQKKPCIFSWCNAAVSERVSKKDLFYASDCMKSYSKPSVTQQEIVWSNLGKINFSNLNQILIVPADGRSFFHKLPLSVSVFFVVVVVFGKWQGSLAMSIAVFLS